REVLNKEDAMRRFFATVFVLAVFLCPIIFADGYEQSVISVSGKGEVRVIPDQIMLCLGVESTAKELEVAKSENDQKIAKILQVGRKHNVRLEDIQTDYVTMEPQYASESTKQNLLGYIVRRSIAITIKNPDDFDQLLADSLNAGANRVDRVSFTSAKSTLYRAQARALAMKAAKDKAAALAAELGQKIGKAYKIVEDTTPESYWNYSNSNVSTGA